MSLFKKKKIVNTSPQYLYSEKELDEYENHLQKYYGEYSNVFHEIVSPDIHLDVVPIPPTEKAPYYKIVTMGAGAYKMSIPAELKNYNLEYAEYVIYLPTDWKITSSDPIYYWPIGMLKKTARIPIDNNTWLGYGHTIQANSDNSPLAENTKLNSLVLLSGLDNKGEKCDFKLSSGKQINFYQIVPLYQEELDFIMANSVDALFSRFPDSEFPMIINPGRKNYCL